VWVVAWLALSGVALVACVYKPKVPEGSIRCDDSQRCPMGLLCHAVRDGATLHLVCCRPTGCEGLPRPAGGRALVSTPDEAWADEVGDAGAGAGGQAGSDAAPPP
jgi:hypothetical protein